MTAFSEFKFTTALSIETTEKKSDKLPRREKPHHLTERSLRPHINLFNELYFPASLWISFAPADNGIFTCFIAEVH